MSLTLLETKSSRRPPDRAPDPRQHPSPSGKRWEGRGRTGESVRKPQSHPSAASSRQEEQDRDVGREWLQAPRFRHAPCARNSQPLPASRQAPCESPAHHLQPKSPRRILYHALRGTFAHRNKKPGECDSHKAVPIAVTPHRLIAAEVPFELSPRKTKYPKPNATITLSVATLSVVTLLKVKLSTSAFNFS